MKRSLIYAVFFFNNSLLASPTCTAKVSSHTIPFFAQEFYQPGKQTTSPITAVEYGKKELQKLIEAHKGKK